MNEPTKRVHFVGIGGVGMSAIAEVLLARGVQVSGSDLHPSPTTRRLAEHGATISIGHDAAHVVSADIVVASAAIAASNVELAAARTGGIPVRHRAEILAEILASGESIAVVGTHGKTTTAALTAHVLVSGGFDPLALVGADVVNFGANVRLGHGRYVVAEVDESDGSLLHVRPSNAVVTSLDLTDHHDHYRTHAQLMETFATFVSRVPPTGVVVLAVDHPNVRELAASVAGTVATYALSGEADYTATIQRFEGATTSWTLLYRGTRVCEVTVPLPGRYNVANALGATAVAHQAGMTFPQIAEALRTFQGLSRRFAVHGEIDGIMIIDDYAHNPTKIAAVLRGAKESWPTRHLIVVFQPHRFTRTQTTYQRFADAFQDADELLVTPIYAADETPIPGVSSALIVEAVRAHRVVTPLESAERVVDYLIPRLRRGDLVLTLGAGDIWRVADALVSALRKRGSHADNAPLARGRDAGG